MSRKPSIKAWQPKPGDMFRAFVGEREATNQPTKCTQVYTHFVCGVDAKNSERRFDQTMWSFKPVEDKGE